MNTKTLTYFFDTVARVIGEENVSRNPAAGALQGPQGQASYGDPYSPDAEHKPCGAVRTSTAKEVQSVVRHANEYRVPL